MGEPDHCWANEYELSSCGQERGTSKSMNTAGCALVVIPSVRRSYPRIASEHSHHKRAKIVEFSL
jgi:hypothetical protein